MAVYNVSMSMNYGTITIKNNSNNRYRKYGLTTNNNTEIGYLERNYTDSYNADRYKIIIIYSETDVAYGDTILYVYTRLPSTEFTMYNFIYIDSNGILKWVHGYKDDVNFSNEKVSDTISPGGLSTLHIDDTRVEQINYNNKSYTSFPVDIPLVPNVKTMTVIGKTFNVQLDNELNIVRVKDGQTEYRQFPATIMVGENKALQLYGKEDPEITIDYTGTQDPVISNTPATPPPVV